MSHKGKKLRSYLAKMKVETVKSMATGLQDKNVLLMKKAFANG